MNFLDRLQDDWTGSLANAPARVRNAVREQEERGEIIISWVQLSIAVFFFVLYFFSEKPPTMRAESVFLYRPVYFALGVYGAFTLARLYLAMRRRLPRVMVTASIVADVALLLTTIWSFHLQYGEPLGLSLQAPTMLYIFIFIAIRALRFDPGYVLIAGLVAAAGWMSLLMLALGSPGVSVTDNYVTYISSTQYILIGAEIDKIISILIVTAILAAALALARRTMITAVAEGQASKELTRFVGSAVARQIRDAEERLRVGEGTTREAAIMYLDLRGFTPLAEELAPDQVMGVLAEYQSHVVPVIRKHGGIVDKYLGDGIMATFGAEAPTETFAADALRAVEELYTRVAEWNAVRVGNNQRPMQVGMAVAAGEMIVGAVGWEAGNGADGQEGDGEDDRLEFTVIGNAVNLAAKLEKQTKAESCCALTTQATLETAVSQGYHPSPLIEARPQRTVGGVAEPVDLVVLAPSRS